MDEKEVTRRITTMANSYYNTNDPVRKKSIDEEVKTFLQTEAKDNFQKHWIYYNIRKED